MDDVKLIYKREGEKYVGVLEHSSKVFEFKEGIDFASMMMHTNRFLVQHPQANLFIHRVDRDGMLPVKLEPKLLEQLRNDPLAYIKSNTVAPRVLDLRGDRKSALSQNQKDETPRHDGLRHGLDTLADAFGEELYARAKQLSEGHWVYEHPGTGRWADLTTVEHWLGSHSTEVHPVDHRRGWLLIKAELILRTKSERLYYPREWNEFGSWITKEQLRVKLDQFRKDKANAR